MIFFNTPLTLNLSRQTVIIIFVTSLFASCNPEQTNLEFEKAVAAEIFPSLLDSVYYDTRLVPPPPPPPKDFKPIDSAIIERSKAEFHAEYARRVAALEKDTTKLVVAIVDSAYQIGQEDRKELIEFFKDYNIELDSLDGTKSYKINIANLKHDKKFKLIYRSELPSTTRVWDEDYDFQFSGITGFSRIQFDKSRKFGVFVSGFGCGRLCGFSCLVFIKKDNGKWIIEEIKITGIS